MHGSRAIRILGIDPGSRRTGYGLIETRSGRSVCLKSGVVSPRGADATQRIQALHRDLRDLVADLAPDEAAIEQVFVKRNVASALVLGQARGAAICALADADCTLHEYSPASIKQAVTGSGRADKFQVQHMVKALLGLARAPAADASDALACALCHAHSRTLKAQVARGIRR